MNTFSAIITNTNLFATLLKSISPHNRYAFLEISKDHLNLWSVDFFGQYLFNLYFKQNFFKNYHITREYISFKINIEKLSTIINLLKGKEREFELSYDGTWFYVSDKYSKCRTIIKFETWPPDAQLTSFDKEECLDVVISADDFIQTVKRISKIADELSLKFNYKRKLLVLEGSKRSISITTELQIEDLNYQKQTTNYVYDKGQLITINVIIDYVKQILPIIKEAKQVIISLGGGRFLKIKVPIDRDNVMAYYYLANQHEDKQNHSVHAFTMRTLDKSTSMISIDSTNIFEGYLKIMLYLKNYPEGVDWKTLKNLIYVDSENHTIKENHPLDNLLKKDILTFNEREDVVLSPKGDIVIKEYLRDKEKGVKLLKKLLQI